MRSSIALISCSLVCAAAFLIARSPPQNPTPSRPTPQAPAQQPPTFRAGIDIVQLDVSVLDKARQPVHGLTAQDFTVLEDDKPQSIEHFEEVVLPDPVEPPAAWMKRISPDVATNDLHESRVVVIVMDDAALPGDPGITKAVKSIGRDIVSRLGPNDVAAVIYTMANRQKTQDFTSDHAKLLAAVEKYTPGFATFGVDANDYLFYQYSENVLHDVADYLIALPNRRKTLIYVSGGVPVDPAALAPVLIGSGAPVGPREEMVRLNDDLRELIKRAQRANVAIYPIDATGFDGVHNYVLNRLLAKGSPYPGADAAATHTARLSLDFLLENADNTGGRATVNTNDFTEGITQIFRENGSYYLLGYRQSNPKGPNSYSRLDVRVNRKDVEVRSRHINYTPKQDKALTQAAPETQALAGLLPDPSTPLRVTAVPFARPSSMASSEKKADPAEAVVAIVLGVQESAPAARTVEHVDLLTRAFDAEGGAVSSHTQAADVTIRPAPAGQSDRVGRYEVLTRVALKPGRYQLRLGLNNSTRAETGSVFIDVEVPDFAKDPLSLSGVVFDSAASPQSAPRDALTPLIPVIPTTDREFPTTAQVRSFLRIYQGGKSSPAPVSMRMTITDDHDAVVFTSSTTLAPARFSTDRAADFRIDLPLTQLEPGPHLLTFEATMGNAMVRRDVVFAVK